MKLERHAKPSVTPFGLNHGDELTYLTKAGDPVRIELLDTHAEVLEREYHRKGYGAVHGEVSIYGFSATLRINGDEIRIQREVGSQQSFYEPVTIAGVHLWLDAVKCIFDTSYDHHTAAGGFLIEKDFLGGHVCMPRQHARFAIQDADASICPEPVGMWCKLPHGGVRIEDCYNGEDCWMGPYGGAFAHCGLDINMPRGSLLRTPIPLDIQYYYNTVAAGFNNNRWCGFRTWEDGSIWRISSSHLIDPLVDENIALPKGTEYATTAGTAIGAHEHTHFNLIITEQGGTYLLDPWILFWQALKDK